MVIDLIAAIPSLNILTRNDRPNWIFKLTVCLCDLASSSFFGRVFLLPDDLNPWLPPVLLWSSALFPVCRPFSFGVLLSSLVAARSYLGGRSRKVSKTPMLLVLC